MVSDVTTTPSGLDHWAAVAPDRIAMIDGAFSLSWSEWKRRADALADGLAAFGVGAGDVVALRMGTRWEWLVASCAVAKIGGRILGVNWRLQPHEIGFMLEESGAVLLIFDDREAGPLIEAVRAAGVERLISIDVPMDEAASFADLIADPAPPPRVAADHAPIILYTSGTTGRPKGVQTMTPPDARSAAELSGYVRSVEDAIPRSPDDVLLLTMPLHHGAGPALVRAALYYGTRIIILRKFDARRVVELIGEHGVTYWSAVPTMVNRVSALDPALIAAADFSSLRALNIGAAPVPSSLKLWIIEHIGPILHEGYGSTETSMITHLDPASQTAKLGSSGRPHRNVAIRIKGSDGAILPIGNAGEIWVRTPVTIHRYLNQPPMGPDLLDGDGFFRTGDVGRFDEDGFLFVTDRIKDMIVSGGVNIYPAEIEQALRESTMIFDAAVIGIPDDDFGESVLAFCELRPGVEARPADILADIRGRLASYKVPRDIRLIDELPRNIMGKVLKTELRAPFWAGRDRKI